MRSNFFRIISIAAGVAITALALLWIEDKYTRRVSITPLNKDVSLTDSRVTLDVAWLEKHGYHTLIYLRNDGFFNGVARKAKEKLWIDDFQNNARNATLKFFETGPHDRKHFNRNWHQLRQALDDSVPPVLIYSDRTRNASVIWGLAEASRSNGMARDDILGAADGFQTVPDFYRIQIMKVFSDAHGIPASKQPSE